MTGLLGQTPTVVLGWSLVHFVWQGAVVAAVLRLVLGALPAAAAEVRYRAGCAALAVLLAAPIVTTVHLEAWLRPSAALPSGAIHEASGRSVAAVGSAIPGAGGRPVAMAAFRSAAAAESALVNALTPVVPWLPLFWAIGVIGLTTRLGLGLRATRRLVRDRTRPASEPVLRAIERLADRLRVTRPVRALESALVEVPTVVGWLRPALLVPASALTGLTAVQLDALLSHELAHVRRNDVLVNLGQALVETLLFYHPAVWWVSRQVRIEREHCCDDLAVAACGDAVAFARALSRMEEIRSTVPVGAVAASGGSLMQRVRRLVQNPSRAADRSRRAGLPAAAVVALASVVLVAHGASGMMAAGEPAFAPHASTASSAPQPPTPVSAPPAEPAPVTAALAAPSPVTAPRVAAVAVAPRAVVAPAVSYVGIGEGEAYVDDSSSGFAYSVSTDGPALAIARRGSGSTVSTYVTSHGRSIRVVGDGDASMVFHRTLDDGLEIQMMVRGTLALEADDSILDGLEPGSRLELETRDDAHRQRLIVTIAESGARTEQLFIDGRERSLDDAGRAWRDAALEVIRGHWQISGVRGQRSALRGQMSAVRGQRSALRGQMSAVRGQRSAIRGQLSATRGQRSALRGQMSAIRGAQSAHRGAISSLRGRISALRTERDMMARRDGAATPTAAIDAEIADVEARIDELGRELDERIARDDERLHELERQIAAISVEEAEAAADRRIRELDVDSAVAELERQIAALDVEGQVVDLEQEIEALDVDGQIERIRRETIEPAERALRAARAALRPY